MNVSIGEHITLLCYALLVGVMLGALYDAVRLVRTFLGLGINYRTSPFISSLTPPLIGRRPERTRRLMGKAAACAVIFVFDILYMAAAAAVTVIFIYHASSGTPRGFALFGEAVGFIMYMKTVGKLTAAASSYIFFAAETVFRYILFFTLKPASFVLRRAWGLVKKIYGNTVDAAVRKLRRKKASVRLDRCINKDMQKMFAEIADALARDGTE